MHAASAHTCVRVFVASYGNDANQCTFGSAVDVADAGGEVTAIDSADFDPITKAVPFDPGNCEVGPPGSLLSR